MHIVTRGYYQHTEKLEFIHLRLYATHVLKYYLDDFSKQHLHILLTLNLPVLKNYDLNVLNLEKLVSKSIPSDREFLEIIIQNKLDNFIEDSLRKWITSVLHVIKLDVFVAEDIFLATYARKKALISFIDTYTSDINTAIELVREIDDYILQISSGSFHTYINTHSNDMNDVLKKHEADLLEVQEIASLGSFDWDLTGIHSTFTPQVSKIFELEESNALEDFLNYVHPGDREKLQEAIGKALNGEDNFECEYRYRKNGKEKVLWTKGVILFNDKGPHIMKATVMDITDRHYILKRLERNEELYKQAQKLTHIGNWTWELDTGEIKFSDEMCRIYGLKAGVKIDFEMFNSFVHSEDKNYVNEQLQYSVKTGKPHALDFRVVRNDGSVITIRRNVDVLIDEKEIPYKVYGTGQDITNEIRIKSELAELNASLAQKNIALEKSNKELTSFSYVASHDLQEPLRKIKSFSNMILEKEHNLTENGKICFDRIVVSADRMQKLIEDLLLFSRTQVYEHKLEPVDINILLAEIKLLHVESITEGQLIIESDQLPVVQGISFQLQQLIENIISNSIKYSKAGQPAKINVNCALLSANEIPFFNSFGFEFYYKISLSDNGIGFEQTYSEKIFEIFQRLHGKNEYSGTGIGLSICKKIVENHQGYISAKGVIDEGATFDIYLPVSS
jgi:PAS domain S-box-containing protein